MITQVAGRTGRSGKKGEVVIQTHLPEHPMLTSVIKHGYKVFAQTCIEERIEADLPPHTFTALFQAEASSKGYAQNFLQGTKELLRNTNAEKLELLGPVPALHAKVAGKHRFQLYLQSKQRAILHSVLKDALEEISQLDSASRVRWRLEIDPLFE